MKFGRAALSREHTSAHPYFIAGLVRAPRALTILALFHGVSRGEDVLSHGFQDVCNLALGYTRRRVPRACQRLGHLELPEEVGLERRRSSRPLDVTVDGERSEGQGLLPPTAIRRDRRDQTAFDDGVGSFDLPACLGVPGRS